jgi:hypothetical protein
MVRLDDGLRLWRNDLGSLPQHVYFDAFIVGARPFYTRHHE